MKMRFVIPAFAGMTGNLPNFSPLTSQILFSKKDQNNPENNQNDTNAMVDPRHRLLAAEPADMMRNKAFQQVRRQCGGQNAGKKYCG